MAELIANVQIMPHETIETLLAAYQSLEREWRKTITELNAIKAERAADLAALELNNKTLAARDKVIAAAIGYCKRHTHSGVTLSAHVCLLDVLKILEGKEWPAGTDNCGEDANCTSTVQPSSSSKAGGQA